MTKAVIFDLDGTIGDTLPLCVAAFRKAVADFTDAQLSDDEIIATFGPSEEGTLRQLIPEYYPEGLDRYLHHYQQLHDTCPEPFEGIREIIEKVKSSGLVVTLVTGKGLRSCEITLDRYGMTHLFDRIETGSPEGPRKTEGIRAVLDFYRLSPAEALYVGDAASDIEVCHKTGVPIVAAAWAATARPEELIPLEPQHLFYTVPELAAYLQEEVLREYTAASN